MAENTWRRSVAITGGSAGFGARLALAFAKPGFDILLCGRDGRRLSAVQESIRAQTSSRCHSLAGDLCTAEGQGALAAALQRHRVDVLVNNAAINPELADGNAFYSAAEISNIITTNTAAAIAVCVSAFEHFRTSGRGIIINLNSVAGLLGSRHEPLYAASKFGLRGFSESVKDAWLAQGVRVIDVYSGAIATGMSAGRPDVADLIDPDELASFIVNLSSTRSFYPREINVQKTPLALRHGQETVSGNGAKP